MRGTKKKIPTTQKITGINESLLEKFRMPATIKIIGQEKRTILKAGSIQPKLKKRISRPAITNNKPNMIPFDLPEKGEAHELVFITRTY